MAKLTAKTRKEMPKKEFGLPGEKKIDAKANKILKKGRAK